MRKTKHHLSSKEIRIFGLVILVGFGLIGALLYRSGNHTLAQNVWQGAGGVCLLALVWPAAAKPIYRLWIWLGMGVGFVVSRVVLTALFYGLITPIAIAFRLRKRDELGLSERGKSSYWHDHPQITDKKYYEHLF